MDLRQLRYFVAIVEHGSLVAAAQHVHVAQPALSHHVSNLEAELGQKLFERTARGVLPTKIGSEFYHRAKLILRTADQAVETVKRGGEMAGIVSLGVTPTSGLVLGLPILMRATEQFPSLKVNVVERLSGHLYEMTRTGLLDLSIMFDSRPAENMDVEMLGADEMVLVGNADMFERFGIGPTVDKAMLATLPLFLSSATHFTRRKVDNEFARLGIRPTVSSEIDSVTLTMDAVEKGLGFTIRCRGTARGPHGKFRTARISDGLWIHRFYLHAGPVSIRSVACNCLVEIIKSVAAELIADGTLTAS
ncbi:LysR substrate-binding domain-containing protein [Bordetella genomosp. 10]|uniref:LysR substrate-binding domain-containing protein n=1 Tax=Bordetella genomosp. 10 TaxID=1416804 RepID=UPI0011773756|nr:LysR substrate-binding domain-containing protein [Bordetella genomosp. 10]